MADRGCSEVIPYGEGARSQFPVLRVPVSPRCFHQVPRPDLQSAEQALSTDCLGTECCEWRVCGNQDVPVTNPCWRETLAGSSGSLLWYKCLHG